MVLEGEDGVVLKLLGLEDAEPLFALTEGNRTFLKRWLPWLDSVQAVADSRVFVQLCQRNAVVEKAFQFGIWSEGQMVGMIGHNTIDWVNKNASIGYWLGEEFVGAGRMTRACSCLISWSFRRWELNRLEISCAVGNAKSRAIPQRLGFHYEGTLRQKEWLYDHFVDLELYGLCARDWDAGQGKAIRLERPI